MIIKTRQEILKEMIRWSRNTNSKITDYNIGSVIRGIFTAVSAILAQLYYETYRLFRSARISYANGPDLDNAVARRSIKRQGATKSSVLLLFTGTDGTSIPEATRVATDEGIEFTTIEAGTIGTGSGSGIACIEAEAVVAGKTGNVLQNKITTLVDDIPGVSTVTNERNAVGGYDKETDEMLRNRAINQLATLSLGIPASYNAWAIEAHKDILKAKAEWGNINYSDKTVVIHCVKYNGGMFTTDELLIMENYIQLKAPLGVVIKCVNVSYKVIDVSATVTRKTGYNLTTVNDNMISNLQVYLDYRTWEWGVDVDRNDLFAICNNTLGVDDLTSFAPANSVSISDYELPKLGSVTLSDIT